MDGQREPTGVSDRRKEWGEREGEREGEMSTLDAMREEEEGSGFRHRESRESESWTSGPTAMDARKVAEVRKRGEERERGEIAEAASASSRKETPVICLRFVPVFSRCAKVYRRALE